MDIKPIETKYKGYRFRSRLEARWAVFLDAIGANWKYEIEGFDLEGIKYLPDFRIELEDNREYFIEIKPKNPSIDEIIKAQKLCIGKNCPLIIFTSDPYSYWGDVNSKIKSVLIDPKGTIHNWDSFESLLFCGKLKSKNDFELFLGNEEIWINVATSLSARIAANKSNSARFEFGESG